MSSLKANDYWTTDLSRSQVLAYPSEESGEYNHRAERPLATTDLDNGAVGGGAKRNKLNTYK